MSYDVKSVEYLCNLRLRYHTCCFVIATKEVTVCFHLRLFVCWFVDKGFKCVFTQGLLFSSTLQLQIGIESCNCKVPKVIGYNFIEGIFGSWHLWCFIVSLLNMSINSLDISRPYQLLLGI